jgi:prephenate dehydratase
MLNVLFNNFGQKTQLITNAERSKAMQQAQKTIAYLGPLGTYTHEAAIKFVKALGIDEPEFLPFSSFDEVFDAVDRGHAAYGVVGKENSIEGPVTATLDNFAFRSNAVILAETVIDVHHCLVCAPDTSIDDIDTVASHSQGLAQCRRFLSMRLPGRETIITSSTAQSALLASDKPNIAGIANELAAEIHGCRIAARNIEDHMGNQTAFALIGRVGSAAQITSDKYKTTLALFLNKDRSGELNMILSELAYAGINLSMIQSRPMKQQLGDYMFFVEFSGKDTELATQSALACLRLKLREVKVLGSYPVI